MTLQHIQGNNTSNRDETSKPRQAIARASRCPEEELTADLCPDSGAFAAPVDVILFFGAVNRMDNVSGISAARSAALAAVRVKMLTALVEAQARLRRPTSLNANQARR